MAHRVVKICLEVDIAEHKVSDVRLKTAYNRAVEAALRALSEVMLPGALGDATSSLDYGYRHTSTFDVIDARAIAELTEEPQDAIVPG